MIVMTTIVLNLATRPEPLSPNRQFAGYVYSLRSVQRGTEAVAELTMETNMAFPDAEPGDYVASVQAMDTQGEPLGEAVSIDIVVGDNNPPPGTYPAPAGLSYTLV
jgi:hypothetical protein